MKALIFVLTVVCGLFFGSLLGCSGAETQRDGESCEIGVESCPELAQPGTDLDGRCEALHPGTHACLFDPELAPKCDDFPPAGFAVGPASCGAVELWCCLDWSEGGGS